MPMQQVAVGTSITLDATFTTGTGQVTDPDGLRVSIFDPDGVERVSNAIPTRLSLGRYAYTYAVAADAPLGAWEIRWDGTIAGAPVGGTEAFVVVGAGGISFNPENPAVGWLPLAQVEVALGRTLSLAERPRAEQLVGQLVRLLERRLNRDLVPRRIVGERHTISTGGRLNLNHGPVGDVQAVRSNGTPVGGAYGLGDGYLPGDTVTVDYTTTGLSDADDVQGVIAGAVAAAVRADAARGSTVASTGAAAAGPVKSFSVEGLSISYGDATVTPGGSAATGIDAPLTVGSLKGIGRLRRPVLL